MTWMRAWRAVTRTSAVFFALATSLIGRGFTGAVEPDAGAPDSVSWIVIGIVLFAGLFLAPMAERRGIVWRVLVGLAMIPAALIMVRVFVELNGRPNRDLGLLSVFAIGLMVHVLAYVMLARGATKHGQG